MTRKYLLVLILVYTLAGIPVAVATPPVTGTIAAADTKEPLPYANIIVKGTTRGTVANSLGNFTLSTDSVQEQDTITIRYLGYETLQLRLSDLPPTVFLKPSSLLLQEIQILSRSLKAEEIVKIAEKQYSQNYLALTGKQRIYYHKQEHVTFPKNNQLIVKKSNFEGMDKKTVAELFARVPHQTEEYRDVLVDLYGEGEEYKLTPLQAITYEDEAQKLLLKEIESKLSVFIKDLEKSKDEEVYYKFRTGILGHKFGFSEENDALWQANKKDTLHFTGTTKIVKAELLQFLEDYTNIESSNWDFITHTGKYNYTLLETTYLKEEPVYKISFTPLNRGLFKGVLYISTSSYAVIQLDFAFEEGKQSEKFQLMGLGHALNFKEGRVIFEKEQEGYYPKYIFARQKEQASVNRDFSFMKKQKRFLLDKELNEIKVEAHLAFEMESLFELLVTNHTPLEAAGYAQAKEPITTKFVKEHKKEHLNDLEPTAELNRYRRK